MSPKKRQFSQGHVIFADAFMLFVWVSWVVLQWCDKTPPSDLAMTLVTIYGGFATGGYFALSGYRDGSLNDKEARMHEASCAMQGGCTCENRLEEEANES